LLLSSAAGLVLLHVVRSDLSPVGDRLSEYANGSYGSVMTAAFWALGLGMAALGLGMLVAGGPRGWPRVVPFAVIAAGVGMVVSGVYPTDPVGAPTTAESIHSVASGSASVVLIGAAVTWSVLRWGRRPRPALGVTGVLACSALGLGAASPILHDTAWTGLSQRLLWLTLLAWLLLTAWQLDVHPAAQAAAL
jgi:hypothetical protein